MTKFRGRDQSPGSATGVYMIMASVLKGLSDQEEYFARYTRKS